MRSTSGWLRALSRSQDAVYVVNEAQRIVCWNAGARRLLGHSEAEVLNQPCYQVIGGMVSGKCWCHAGCAVQQSAKHGALLQTFDMQAIARDGREVSLGVSAFTLERKGKRYTVHLLQDRTREEHTKEALENFLDALHSYGVTDGDARGTGNPTLQSHNPVSDRSRVAQLTRREIEVLELLAEGLSTKDVARSLGVSLFTVRSHIESILLKTGVHTQAQAVAYAYRNGLL